MSQTVADLLDSFRRAAPSDREAAVSAILADWLGGPRQEPLPVPGDGGRTLGYLVPLPPAPPPVLSPEREAELAARAADPGNCRDLSEYIDRL
jgi:hypothetical protein